MNGTDKTPIKMSEMAKLMRNFRRFRADRFPYISTRITKEFPVNARKVVNEYNVIKNACSPGPNASNVSISKVEPKEPLSSTEVKLLSDSQTGSAIL